MNVCRLNFVLFLCFLKFSELLGHLSRQRVAKSHLVHDKEIIKNDETVCLNAQCVPFVQCPAHVRAVEVKNCKIIGGRLGVCCSSGRNHTALSETKERSYTSKFDTKTLEAISRKSRSDLVDLRSRESRILSAGHSITLDPDGANYGHFRNTRIIIADLSGVMEVASRALELAIATRAFKDRQGITNQQLEMGVLQHDLSLTPLGNVCSPPPFCHYDSEKYRRIDGSCNNVNHPTWGSSLSPYSRLLPPNYDDGIWNPRTSVYNNQPLPNPRIISTTLFSDRNVPNNDYTLMVMQFGQFLSHDITQSLDMTHQNGSAIRCCTQDGSAELEPEMKHYACMPISIPNHDPFYAQFGKKCMNFVRSILAPNHHCTLGYAQQMNKITHFIDGSLIYGSSPEQTGELRRFMDGKLKAFNDFGRELLPLEQDPDACLTQEQGSACFTSGDSRTNQMISLVVLHTIFMREHNRLAEELAKLNPYWDDQKLFLEARQIVIAELQVIVYKEFLPAIIGNVAMEEFQLWLQDGDSYAYDYDENLDPSITNEFAAAAYRFGHSTVDGLLRLYGPTKVEEMISIPEVMFHPARLRKKQIFDEILSTLSTEPIQDVDNFLSDSLTKYMFRAGNPFGVDLVSLNIQRGRDHGLRSYNDYRNLVGLPRLKSFDEFHGDVSELLKKVYKSVDDIDLWVGGLLEEKAPGALVGYTFRDIIADQFYRLKKGDRYFFENDPTINPGAFNPDQLLELRKASMSRLICDNSDGILLARQALNAFRKPGVQGNEFTDCESSKIPKLNLIYWQL